MQLRLAGYWVWSLCLGCTIMVNGCSNQKPMGTVRGTVTVRGKSFNDAAIFFDSDVDNFAGSVADLQEDGLFEFGRSLPVGSYTVYFGPKSTAPRPAASNSLGMNKFIPEKYWSTSSDIKVNVKQGENIIPVEIK